MGKVRKLFPVARWQDSEPTEHGQQFPFYRQKGLLATYDIRLKTIADNYHSNKNKNADITSSMKESIST